jgi:leader peptidase (prepilin peptidase)/N-methyltransferase
MTTAVALLFGLALGSFANACIDRLRAGEPITGRSRCDACRAPLAAWELVPLASYIALAGRCRRCAAPIGVRTPLVEATVAAGVAFAFTALAAPVAVAVAAAFVLAVIAVGVARPRRSAA